MMDRFDFLLLLFFRCVCCCVVVVCGEASAFCFFWNEEEEEEKKKNQKKNDEKKTKRERSQKKFSELHQLHYTHKCEHIPSSNEAHCSIYYSRNSNIFFLLDYSRANIPIS